MHTIVIVSESGKADDGLKKQLQMLFPDCRIEILPKAGEKSDTTSGKPAWYATPSKSNGKG